MVVNSTGPERATPPSPRNDVRSTPKKLSQDPIAVVGMACRLPGDSNSPHKLWNFLEKGGIAHNEAPPTRFGLDGHHDGSKKPKTMRSPGGMFLENIDLERFDAQFFEIPRADVIAMDPQQRQLLEVVYECLENAGIPMRSLSGTDVGCFVGSYAVDYADMQSRDPEDRVPSVTIGVGRAILSNRISHFLNIKGPSMTIDTACSGSLVGLDVACRYLHTGEINGAIIAGANLYLCPEHNMDSGPMKGASSLSGKCHTFDSKADGYIKAEAINAVMLKRLDDALRDGDPIRAIIRGTATNSDGHTPGIASPSSEAQAAAMRAAYAHAGITNFNDTAYLECHGTGTQAGDPTEVDGVASVFSASRSPEHPLIIGSVKSNIGHSEPGAGISGLLKAILSLEAGVIPGNPTFIDPNPNIDFAKHKVKATQRSIPWPKNALRRASVNSFGYGGSNAHVVVESPEVLLGDRKSSHVSSLGAAGAGDDFFGDDAFSSKNRLLVFSANNESSLRTAYQDMRRHLLNPMAKVDIDDLAFTLSERRNHHFLRGFVMTNTLDLDESALTIGKKSGKAARIGLVFTGQGAQWSQMGKALIEHSSTAALVLRELDLALQSCAHPPSWSLITELSSARSPDTLRKPEFSQPLCTAIQLGLLAVLQIWGVEIHSVVGHSSGEIAAAHAAGYITRSEAIKIAYYRGKAAMHVTESGPGPVGMLAVGLAPEKVKQYFHGLEDTVSIACYNSPDSVTISGLVKSLETLKQRLVEDTHFARQLQVDLAYHSSFMKKIGNDYEQLLSEDTKPASRRTNTSTTMFSTVFGRAMGEDVTDVAYWKANMVSPVLFEQGGHEMMTATDPIKKSLPGQGTNISYSSAWSRGAGALKSLFDVAGQLFIHGNDIDLKAVNREGANGSPSVITDLPNYSWDHTGAYWYENEASKDWRYRLFPHHDLLGSKILGTSWHSPTWKKSLNIDDLTWLKDHKMGPDIIFPAAGYMAMAMEAMMQTNHALAHFEEGTTKIVDLVYKLRDVTFPKALVLTSSNPSRISLSLSRTPGVNQSWWEFTVRSMRSDAWMEHSRGLIRIDECDASNTETNVKATMPLEHAVSGNLWYKAMHDIGYNFGPAFQPQLSVESTSGSRESRSVVSLAPASAEYAQSWYPVHPAALDGCLQTCAPSLWAGYRSDIKNVLIPAIIDELVIHRPKSSKEDALGTATANARYVGIGLRDETINYISNSTIYDQATGDQIFKLSGLRYHKLDTAATPYDTHTYSLMSWKPCLDMATPSALTQMIMEASHAKITDQKERSWSATKKLLDLAAHQKPNCKVFELNAVHGDSFSVWLDGPTATFCPRAACAQYTYVAADAKALLDAEQEYGGQNQATYHVLDAEKVMPEGQEPAKDVDLLIVKLNMSSLRDADVVMQNASRLLAQGGSLVVLSHKSCTNASSSAVDGACPADPHAFMFAKAAVQHSISAMGFQDVTTVPIAGSDTVDGIFHARWPAPLSSPRGRVDVVQFSEASQQADSTMAGLEKLGWNFVQQSLPGCDDPAAVTVVLDELGEAVMPDLSEEHWQHVQKLMGIRSKLLWITAGSQMEVTTPDKAMIHGLTRTVRNENPAAIVTTLDVEVPGSKASIAAIDTLLSLVHEEKCKDHLENEFAERSGVLHVARMQPNDAVNTAELAMKHQGGFMDGKLHDFSTTVRLQSERVGTLDSLVYTEVSKQELPLNDEPNGRVEVELFAAGLNFKDVAIAMGIVPENQHLLGLEGAGTVLRVSPKASKLYKPGDRVLVFEKGTFGNRVIATTERTVHIPDWMTYEQASTLPSVYLTALYSIYNLANTKKGDKVLIHSASGGLGIASIQICQHIGAEVFATVGTQDKRDFLKKTFGLPTSHILNSRSTGFANALRRETKGYGIDVILNSLTGDMLDESWRCIADGGTMVELGKRDMLDRNNLSMEPFGRNASYRCFDMSHKHVSDAVIAGLLTQLMELVNARKLTPIAPVALFRFDEIQAAMHYMRKAQHIGKIVISNQGAPDENVAVRPAQTKLEFPTTQSILIVGGLRGLCGSLACYLAKLGAKHLVVLGRSAYDDERSQAVVSDLAAQGCHIDLCRGDVSKYEDVVRCYKSASVPIGGVIQGAMVLRDQFFENMTHSEYHTAVDCKVAGTWNLHNAAAELNLPLSFFTMLSSVSGVVGQKGQANYAAANAFLDAFAAYRHKLGLPAVSVDLGAIEDVGFMAEHKDLFKSLDTTSAWTPINEGLFHKICARSIMLQVQAPPSDTSAAAQEQLRPSQLITSIAVPQAADSKLLSDARFGALVYGSAGASAASSSNDAAAKKVQTLKLMISSHGDASATLAQAIEVVNDQFVTALRLEEPMEPEKSMSSYGLDSLSAIEVRNGTRADVGVELTVLDITNAESLTALSEKVVGKMGEENDAKEAAKEVATEKAKEEAAEAKQ